MSVMSRLQSWSLSWNVDNTLPSPAGRGGGEYVLSYD